MLSTLIDASPETLAAIKAEMLVRKTGSLVLMFSMGSQFDHLIMQQLAARGIFALVADPSKVTAADVRSIAPKGIIVSGGPASVHAEAPPFDSAIFDIGTPVFGICLGAQMAARHAGAKVSPAHAREFGIVDLRIVIPDDLFAFWNLSPQVLQSHGDIITRPVPDGFEILATTPHSPIAAFRYRHIVGVQFHPEVSDTENGHMLFENFCGRICGIADRFPAHDVAGQKVAQLKLRIGNEKVLLALSGGSDSSVVAYLLKHATGNDRSRLKGVYIKGIDRPDDEADVIRLFGNQSWIELEIVDATEAFLAAFRGITKSREKRIAMRSVYKPILEQKIREFGASFIAQGTLYTDLVESGYGHATGARRAQIKLHHNTGLEFSVPELMPLSDCVKDNARNIGRDIGVPEELLVRHPFPGPGLSIRIEGEVTAARLAVARKADGILLQELRAAGLYEKIWQAGARILSSEHTTTKGDDAGTGCIVQLFAVSSVNGFTSRPYPLPWEVMGRIADRLGNEIREVGAADIRISGKPYSTIEGE